MSQIIKEPEHTSYELKIIHTRCENSWVVCETCSHMFKVGERRYKWRMLSSEHSAYARAGFWTTQCRECFARNVDEIEKSFAYLGSIINEI